MNYIIDPNTYESFSIFSNKGKKLLKKFIKEYQSGGGNPTDNTDKEDPRIPEVDDNNPELKPGLPEATTTENIDEAATTAGKEENIDEAATTAGKEENIEGSTKATRTDSDDDDDDEVEVEDDDDDDEVVGEGVGGEGVGGDDDDDDKANVSQIREELIKKMKENKDYLPTSELESRLMKEIGEDELKDEKEEEEDPEEEQQGQRQEQEGEVVDDDNNADNEEKTRLKEILRDNPDYEGETDPEKELIEQIKGEQKEEEVKEEGQVTGPEGGDEDDSKKTGQDAEGEGEGGEKENQKTETQDSDSSDDSKDKKPEEKLGFFGRIGKDLGEGVKQFFDKSGLKSDQVMDMISNSISFEGKSMTVEQKSAASAKVIERMAQSPEYKKLVERAKDATGDELKAIKNETMDLIKGYSVSNKHVENFKKKIIKKVSEHLNNI